MPAQSVAGLRQIVNTHRPYRVPDIQADRHWVSFPEMSWLRSYVGVPIRVKGQVVGFLNFDSSTPDFYTAEHARRAQAFADQVALAMQNARSYEAIQRNVRRLTLLHQVGVDLAKTQTAPQLHQQLVRTAMLLVEADGGALSLYDQVNHLTITALENVPASLLGRSIPLGHGISGRAAQLRQIQTTDDYAVFSDRVALFDRLTVGAAITLPLIWQERLIGTLSVAYQSVAPLHPGRSQYARSVCRAGRRRAGTAPRHGRSAGPRSRSAQPEQPPDHGARRRARPHRQLAARFDRRPIDRHSEKLRSAARPAAGR